MNCQTCNRHSSQHPGVFGMLTPQQQMNVQNMLCYGDCRLDPWSMLVSVDLEHLEGDVERLDILVPVGTKAKLKDLADRHRVTLGDMLERLTLGAKLERLLQEAGQVQISMATKARGLFAACGGDIVKARERLLVEMRVKHPGFKSRGAGPGKREYDAIRRQLSCFAKVWEFSIPRSSS